MRVLKINGKKLVFGLTWYELDPDQTISNGIKLRVKAQDDQYGIVIKNDYPCVGLTERSFSKKYSAAALLASINPNALIIEKLENDKYWVCMSINGSIVPSTDVFKKDEDLQNALQDYADIISRAQEPVDIYAPDHAEELKEFLGGHIDESQFLTTGLAGLSKDYKLTHKEKIRDLLYKPLSLSNVIRVAVVLGSCYFGWQFYQDYRQSVDQGIADFSPPQIINKVTDKVEVTQLQLAAQQIQQIVDVYAPTARLNYFKGVVKSPIYKNGWKVVKFSIQTESAYRALWQRIGIGTVNDLVESSDDGVSVNVSNDGKHIELIYPTDFGKQNIIFNEAALRATKNHQLQLISDLQRTHFEWTFADSDQGTESPLAISVSDDTVKQHFFEIKGSGFWFIDDLQTILAKYPSLAISEINIDFENTEFPLLIRGVLYEVI